MHDLSGNHRRPVRHETVDRQRPERPLIGEHYREFSVLRMLDADANALVTFRFGIRRTEQHLPAHPEVRDQSGILCVERKPEELASTLGGGKRASFKTRHEVGGPCGVACQSAFIEHAHPRDDGTDRGRSETRSHHLDFGELRHAR